MTTLSTLRHALPALAQPVLILLISSGFFVTTSVKTLLLLRLRTLFSPGRFQRAWFASFWAWFGPTSARSDETHVAPLLATAAGRVLDLGPGSGLTVKWLDRAKVEKVVGVEPCTDLHPLLEREVQSAGLAGVYEVLGVGAEQLELPEESFDTVVSCKVFCGIPRPHETARKLYSLLKPGGRVLFYEHVRSRSPRRLVRAWQAGLGHLWPWMMQGCEICRDTEAVWRGAGEWEKASFEMVGERDAGGEWNVIPFIKGELVKAGV